MSGGFSLGSDPAQAGFRIARQTPGMATQTVPKVSDSASSTTGVAPGPGLRWVDLPVADVNRGHDAAYLAGRLSEVEGVAKCDVNPITGLAHVAYDPRVISVGRIVHEAR